MEFIRIIFGITFLFVSLQVQAQGKFYNIYSDNGYDFGEGVVQLPDSSYLVTGASSSFGEEAAQAFILHVDKFGNRLWSKSYGGSESERGRRIMHVENDGIYVAGYSSSIGSGSFDFYFFKTDLSGNLIYEKAYGGPNFEKLHDAILVPADTSFILVGETKSNPEEVENIYIMRLNALGDTLWTKQIGSTGIDIARGVVMISDTTFAVVGEHYVADSLMQKALYMKMHIDGTVNWIKEVGANGNYSLNDAAFDNGEIRAVGHSHYEQGGVEYARPFGLVADINGNTVNEILIYLAEYSKYAYLTSYSTQINKFYIAEQTLRGVVPNFGGGGEDVLIARHEGFLYWTGAGVNVSSIGDDQITQLIRTSDGGAMAVGYNTYHGSGGKNVTLMKIGNNDDYVTSYTNPYEGSLVIKNEIADSFEASIYPNPVEEVLQINVESLEIVQVVIMNSFGAVVEKTSFNKLTSINLSEYANGLYLIRLEIAGEFKTFKILKK